MEWNNLIEFEEEYIGRGAIFRFPAVYPFESVVDFMLFLDPHSDSHFSLVCVTGCKAGHHEGMLPEEALAEGEVVAISKNWLVKNWTKWVYPETQASEVRVAFSYPQEIGDVENQKSEVDTSHLDLNV